MPRGDGTGPPGAGGRGMGRGQGRGPGRGKWRAARAGGRCRMAGPWGPQRAAASPGLQPPGVSKEQTYAAERVDTSRSREVAQRAGRPRLVASIDQTTCSLCGACQAVCPTGAITVVDTAFKVNAEACRGCGACAEVCPTEAIRLS